MEKAKKEGLPSALLGSGHVSFRFFLPLFAPSAPRLFFVFCGREFASTREKYNKDAFSRVCGSICIYTHIDAKEEHNAANNIQHRSSYL